MLTTPKSRFGFTLIELLIALTILSITASFAFGAFPIIEKYRVENNARSVVSAVMYARSLAIQEGDSVFLCPTKNSINCDKSWSDKILIYRNQNADKNYDTGDELVRIYDLANNSSQIRWGSFQNKHYLEMRANGMTNFQNGTFTVCHESNKIKTAVPVIINTAGRPYFGRDRNNDGILEYSSGKPVRCS
jgi:type IV fimbrial biogenesis protein FimT